MKRILRHQNYLVLWFSRIHQNYCIGFSQGYIEYHVPLRQSLMIVVFSGWNQILLPKNCPNFQNMIPLVRTEVNIWKKNKRCLRRLDTHSNNKQMFGTSSKLILGKIYTQDSHRIAGLPPSAHLALNSPQRLSLMKRHIVTRERGRLDNKEVAFIWFI